MSVLLAVGFVFAGLAALVHVYIFVLESVLWTRTATRRIFGVRSDDEAEHTRPLAFNQGFYNLFLAIAIAVGIPLSAFLYDAGVTLVLVGAGSMVLAAVVLVASRRDLVRSAAIQGVLPLIAVVLVVVSVATMPRVSAFAPKDSLESVTIEGRDHGLPDGVARDAIELGTPFAVTDAAEPDLLRLVLFGSSTCPPVPEFYDSASPSPLRITLGTTAARVCSADLAATTFDIRVPAGFAPVRAVDVAGKAVEVLAG